MESLDGEKYAGLYDSLHKVTALMFSENPKDPAMIISSFRKESNGEKPVLKAAFINGDIYTGDNSLKALTQIKTKNELIGEVIGLLQSPAKRVLAALLNHVENGPTAKAETEAAVATEAPAAPVAEEAKPTPVAEAPVAEAPTAEAAPEETTPPATEEASSDEPKAE